MSWYQNMRFWLKLKRRSSYCELSSMISLIQIALVGTSWRINSFQEFKSRIQWRDTSDLPVVKVSLNMKISCFMASSVQNYSPIWNCWALRYLPNGHLERKVLSEKSTALELFECTEKYYGRKLSSHDLDMTVFHYFAFLNRHAFTQLHNSCPNPLTALLDFRFINWA